MPTTPEINKKIVELLRVSDNVTCLYAADRIEELEAQIAELTGDAYKLKIVEELNTRIWELLKHNEWMKLEDAYHMTYEEFRGCGATQERGNCDD